MTKISESVRKLGTYVEVSNNNIDYALRIFKRKMKEFQILETYREKQEYIKPAEKRKRAKRAAIAKQKKNNIILNNL
jgi:ribosomal protein S21